MKIIDLSGEYRYETDLEDQGIREKKYETTLKETGFRLPGTACEMKIGKKLEPFEQMDKESVRCLRPAYDYIGPIWFQRDFEISEEESEKAITLFLECVNMASELWVDGKKVGRQIVELTTPHRYNLTGLQAGRHTMTLRVDNRNLIHSDGMASGYSQDTQSIWNGIVGRMELQFQEKLHIDRVDLYPSKSRIKVKVIISSQCRMEQDRKQVTVRLQVRTPNGKALEEKAYQTVLYHSKQSVALEYPLDEMEAQIAYWDEFHPNLYEMNAWLSEEEKAEEASNEKSKFVEKEIIKVKFGMRTIQTEGRKVLLNGHRLKLRGTLECGIYPLTGYPPMGMEQWLETFKIIKSYGLNHVRFHAWCPPEAAFAAADELGVYIP